MGLSKTDYRRAFDLAQRYPKDESLRLLINNYLRLAETNKFYEGEVAYIKSELSKAKSENEFLVRYLNQLENNMSDIKLPEQSTNLDLYKVRKLCEEYVKNEVNGESREDDTHYIFEEVLKTLYGQDIFDKIRELKKKD